MDVVPPNIGKHVLTGVRLLLAGHPIYAFTVVSYAETDSSHANACRRRFFDFIVVK